MSLSDFSNLLPLRQSICSSGFPEILGAVTRLICRFAKFTTVSRRIFRNSLVHKRTALCRNPENRNRRRQLFGKNARTPLGNAKTDCGKETFRIRGVETDGECSVGGLANSSLRSAPTRVPVQSGGKPFRADIVATLRVTIFSLPLSSRTFGRVIIVPRVTSTLNRMQMTRERVARTNAKIITV